MAVGLVAIFFKGSFVQLSLAECTDKVLRVELFVHGSDAPAGYWPVAAGAERPTGRVVVGLAVRKAFVIEEIASTERHLTVLYLKKYSGAH